MTIHIEDSVFNGIQKDINEIKAKLDALSTKKPESDDWMDSFDVIRMLKISSRTLARYRKQGLLTYKLVNKRTIRYKRSDVEKFLNTKTINAFKK